MAILRSSDRKSSAVHAIAVTVNTAGFEPCRGVYIGTSQNLDFSFDGTTWIAFQGCVAGSVIPIMPVGVRKTSGGSAPDAGDIVFLY